MRNLRLKIKRSPSDEELQLSVCGKGKFAYLWIGTEKRCISWKDNSADLRNFLRGALKRMEST